MKEKYSYLINILLFIATFFTTTIAGIEWSYGPEVALNLANFHLGFKYSFAILFILACHEFGHYFASRYHKVKATLPYFIPFPFLVGMINFGTFGAVIKTKSPIPSRKAIFDIGVAGPVAGFFASIIILIYGFLNLPPVEYILAIHPSYFSNIHDPNALELIFGNNILYYSLEKLFTNPNTNFIPPMSEMYHYPFLIVGWFGLFVTAMNLVPAGQLDGGHIFYALFGKEKHLIIAKITFYFLLVLGLLGVAYDFFELPIEIGWTGWLFWAIILKFIIKLPHPEIEDFEEELDNKRKYIGYFAIFIFIVSFIPTPFYLKF